MIQDITQEDIQTNMKFKEYLNESKIPKDKIKKALKYIEDNNFSSVGVFWFDGKKWYHFDYEFGGIERERIMDNFEDIGIGSNEKEWESEKDNRTNEYYN